MDFVSEKQVEAAATEMGKGIDLSKVVSDFKDNQPVLLAYLFSENFKLLTQDEQEYMMFLALVIWKSVRAAKADLNQVDQNLIEELEEKNWDQLNQSRSRMFKERIDPFFENYPQEDLLAFVEDALVYDEDSEVTKEGREYIFVALKTIIDCFQRQD